MVKTDPLVQLKDIHLPQAVSWWPLAPGWYVLGGLIIVLLSALFYSLRKHQRHAFAKKHALVLLNVYKQEYEQDHNAQITSARISELLRRVSLVYYPRLEVASLQGDAWIHFLNKSSKGIDFRPLQSLLLDAPFRTTMEVDLTPLLTCAHLWIKQRGVPCSN